jgi:hypothetical protein
MVHRLKMGLSLCLPDLADALQQQGGGKVAAWHAEPLQQLSRPSGVNLMKLFIVIDIQAVTVCPWIGFFSDCSNIC